MRRIGRFGARFGRRTGAGIGGALALLWAAAAAAGPVYRCEAADGSLAYQDHACAAGTRQDEMRLAAAPPAAASPEYAPPKPARRAVPAGRRAVPRPARAAEPRSYECRAANGEVFYRHSACPASIRPRGGRGTRRARGEAADAVEVVGVELPRSEACRRMAGRRGGDRDERPSAYERNRGLDPCRRW